jgi:mono/diheme cytochrome c family protein
MRFHRFIFIQISIFCFVAIIIAIIGCKSAPQLTEPELAGKKLYESRCAHCHEENDLNLKPAPPSLHRIGEQGMMPNGGAATDAAIIKVVNFGKNKMPGFNGRFSDEEMADLIAYMRIGLH